MPYKKRIVLQPEYMKNFQCIGSVCEDSCCIGWNVLLDRETYFKYKKSKNHQLKPIFDKRIIRNRSQKSSDTAYGRIKMDKRQCPFLDEEKLCRIHKELGPEFLSNTCAIYPRTLNRVDGKFERSATISCPEVARLALLNPDGIGLEQIDEDSNTRININRVFDTEGHLYLNKTERYFWEIRLFALSLLQNRNYSLGDRLIILGMTYNRINELKLNDLSADIPAYLETMAENIGDEGFKEYLANIPVNTQIQMSLAKQLTDIKVVQGITEPSSRKPHP